MRRMGLVLLAAAIAAVFPSCPRGGDSPPHKALAARPLPPPAGAALEPDEIRIVEAEARFLAGLPDAIGRPDLAPEPPPVTIARLKGYTDRFVSEAATLAPGVKALPRERWLVVQDELSRLHHREVEAFYERLGQVSGVYTDERREEARAILAAVLAPWREAGAMWMFDLFSEAAAEEVAEFALGEPSGRSPAGKRGSEPEEKRG